MSSWVEKHDIALDLAAAKVDHDAYCPQIVSRREKHEIELELAAAKVDRDAYCPQTVSRRNGVIPVRVVDPIYCSFYKLREKPFSLLPDPAFFFVSGKHRKALVKLRSGIMNRAGITLITGEIGSGKTSLIQHLTSELQSEIRVGIINNVHPGFDDLLLWVLQAFNFKPSETSKAQLHQQFVQFVQNLIAQGSSALLFVDEAQNMPDSILEELRLLMNVNVDYPAFQVVLVGQPELRSSLTAPAMRQFAQRVAVDHHLHALDQAETEQYIRYRLDVAGGDPALFDARACEIIYYQSEGIPRLVNSLCDTALEYGFELKSETIDGPLVEAILNDEENAQLIALVNPRYARAAGNVAVDEPAAREQAPQERFPMDLVSASVTRARATPPQGRSESPTIRASRKPLGEQHGKQLGEQLGERDEEQHKERPRNLKDALKSLSDLLD